MRKPEILMEDDDIIVVVKPDGMPAQGDKSMSQDLVSYLKTRMVEQAAKSGAPLTQEPYLAVVHRLDRPVGGVMVFAKNQKAAADLSSQIQNGEMVKFYQAVLCGSLPDFEGTFEDYIVKDAKTNRSRICDVDTKDAKEAVLHFEVLDELETDQGHFSYVLIELETGRHHQIRCQMAHHGAPIFGDQKYSKGAKNGAKINQNGKNAKFAKGNAKQHMKNGNGKDKGPGQIGLISTRLEFAHPTTKEWMVFKTEPWGKAFEILDAEEF